MGFGQGVQNGDGVSDRLSGSGLVDPGSGRLFDLVLIPGRWRLEVRSREMGITDKQSKFDLSEDRHMYFT